MLKPGFTFPSDRPYGVIVYRHAPPAQQNLPIFFNCFFDHSLYFIAFIFIPREEYQTRAIIAFGRKGDPGFFCGLYHEFMWYLYEDTRAVTGARVSARGSPVCHAVKYLHAILYDFMRLYSTYIDNKPDTAGILFKSRII